MCAFDRMELIEEIEGLVESLGLRLTIDLTGLEDHQLVELRDALASVERESQ